MWLNSKILWSTTMKNSRGQSTTSTGLSTSGKTTNVRAEWMQTVIQKETVYGFVSKKNIRKDNSLKLSPHFSLLLLSIVLAGTSERPGRLPAAPPRPIWIKLDERKSCLIILLNNAWDPPTRRQQISMARPRNCEGSHPAPEPAERRQCSAESRVKCIILLTRGRARPALASRRCPKYAEYVWRLQAPIDWVQCSTQ